MAEKFKPITLEDLGLTDDEMKLLVDGAKIIYNVEENNADTGRSDSTD
jgi:hypothetical protein